MLVHAGSPRADFIACRWAIDSAGRLACHWEAEGRKPGVGDHTPERFADHELGSSHRGLVSP